MAYNAALATAQVRKSWQVLPTAGGSPLVWGSPGTFQVPPAGFALAVSVNRGFLLVGVFTIRALLFGVKIRAPLLVETSIRGRVHYLLLLIHGLDSTPEA